MADPRFFPRPEPLSVKDLASIGGCDLATPALGDRIIDDIAPLSSAGPQHLSFLDNVKYADAFAVTQAGACVVHPDAVPRAPEGVALLLSARPYRSYALIVQRFYPARPAMAGVADGAHVDPTAILAPDCEVAAGAVIGARAEVGAGAIIGPNAVIGESVVIGAGTTVGANASLSHCLIGARVEIHPGVRIGQRGFGFAMGAEGHVVLPQVGRVIVEDDVEIGANSCIDRGAGPDTVIGRGAKIDNLVMIAHNVRVGPGAVLVAQVGVAGSSSIGAFAVLAGQVGVAGHLKVGNGAQIAAQSGIMRDVEAGESVMGSPAVPIKEHFRQLTALRMLIKRKGKN
ncbi:UDP-3-O-(3-hydroxymyristoyl)glucosamine N-acyltransferase [Radicibacter daui]|uniref:UDP-3-O-(3-hydroxymyristoyl)glucosamine N-acyltransferase n=1 Tax=Radicibacter daui TaxID=3064829 RepID=UPI004046D1DA